MIKDQKSVTAEDKKSEYIKALLHHADYKVDKQLKNEVFINSRIEEEVDFLVEKFKEKYYDRAEWEGSESDFFNECIHIASWDIFYSIIVDLIYESIEDIKCALLYFSEIDTCVLEAISQDDLVESIHAIAKALENSDHERDFVESIKERLLKEPLKNIFISP
ncbi:hypothetical protein P4S55_16470 [Shewanella sp. PP-Sp27a-2]